MLLHAGTIFFYSVYSTSAIRCGWCAHIWYNHFLFVHNGTKPVVVPDCASPLKPQTDYRQVSGLGFESVRLKLSRYGTTYLVPPVKKQNKNLYFVMRRLL